MKKKLLIFIPAYNVENLILNVLNDIPIKKLDSYEAEILLVNDCSNDGTLKKVLQFKKKEKKIKVFVLTNKTNLGYGAVQKLAYFYAIKNNFDFVVMLHGDGQYDPKVLLNLIKPIEKKEADAVFGGRMHSYLKAFKGKMPFHRLLGNIFVTKIQNFLLNTNINEYHTGYRAYSVNVLKLLPFHLNSNYYHFDTEIIIQLLFSKLVIKEIPIETIYGIEKSYLNVIRYGFNVLNTTFIAKLQKLGIFYERKFDIERHQKGKVEYSNKKNFTSSHSKTIKLIEPNSKILDLSLSHKFFKKELKEKKCKVYPIDIHSILNELTYQNLINSDLEKYNLPINEEVFDTVIILNELQRFNEPEAFIEVLSKWLEKSPKAEIIVSTTNISFFTIRLMLLLGFYNHGIKGVLDLSHKRNYTFSSLKKLFEQSGSFKIKKLIGIPAPFPLAIKNKIVSKSLLFINNLLIKIFRGFFSYEILAIIEPKKTIENLFNSAEKK